MSRVITGTALYTVVLLVVNGELLSILTYFSWMTWCGSGLSLVLWWAFLLAYGALDSPSLPTRNIYVLWLNYMANVAKVRTLCFVKKKT